MSIPEHGHCTEANSKLLLLAYFPLTKSVENQQTLERDGSGKQKISELNQEGCNKGFARLMVEVG